MLRVVLLGYGLSGRTLHAPLIEANLPPVSEPDSFLVQGCCAAGLA